ncbi:MAG TPA: hypothetical protein DCY48_04330 [Candidatus Magasanikbacteria bacterium]|nr:MAG: hypothetical protein A3I74_00115 [Candidatus Magasanikbacteria bacterium RIFCSPLOWO2_02_FULL_47_16]OGH80139.1 MAG: hypothetical protein A3C10_03115 [Candidatus Magasanikbacteria bacterium RIFCSPHIGHO2_02_FULL_48_18]OGH82651.1 MAG: hypothetical protein A3G08_02835 [Candidatus Magasanikbacteria bacterium RIFCSPLOWO2_12_FULL_47_9b]HAZ28970.1 hypothetical protein [Candidatus Magasanikbacteria bacterium]
MPPNHFISARDIDRVGYDELLRRTKKFVDEGIPPTLLQGKVIATLIMQTSIRTMTAFQSGMIRAGGGWVGFAESSIGKDETLGKSETWEDLIVTYGSFVDCLLMRHPEDDAAERAARVSSIPIINGGSGTREHALAGIMLLAQMTYHMKRPLQGMKIGIYGTPGAKSGGGRCCTSLIPVLGHYGVDLVIDDLGGKFPIKQETVDAAKQNGLKNLTYDTLDNFIGDVDALILTKAGGSALSPELTEHVKKTFVPVNREKMKMMRDDAQLVVITPRCGEVNEDVDPDPRSLHMKYAPYREVAVAVVTYLLGIEVLS